MSRNICGEKMERESDRETDGDEKETWGSGGRERQRQDEV